MKILIIGAGAIGALYGGKLAQAGAEVSITCRSDYDVIKKNGFHIKSCLGDFDFKPKYVLREAAEYKDTADFIIVTTKVLPQISAIDLIKPALHSNSSILLLQNGIHIEKPIAAAFPKHHLISGLAFVCASKETPGIINHQDYGKVTIGDYPNGCSDKTKLLAQLWNQVGINCTTSPTIQTDRWKKLIWNAAFNPMSVLAGGITTKEIMTNNLTKDLAQKIMQEVYLLAQADNCALPESIIADNLDATAKMTPYKTSMLLDFESKRPMEVEAILGNAVKFAQNKNIATPYLSSLYALISR